jgi:hypothetical protein
MLSLVVPREDEHRSSTESGSPYLAETVVDEDDDRYHESDRRNEDACRHANGILAGTAVARHLARTIVVR